MIIPFPVHKISLKKRITTELYDTLLDKFVSKLKTDYFFSLISCAVPSKTHGRTRSFDIQGYSVLVACSRPIYAQVPWESVGRLINTLIWDLRPGVVVYLALLIKLVVDRPGPAVQSGGLICRSRKFIGQFALDATVPSALPWDKTKLYCCWNRENKRDATSWDFHIVVFSKFHLAFSTTLLHSLFKAASHLE